MIYERKLRDSWWPRLVNNQGFPREVPKIENFMDEQVSSNPVKTLEGGLKIEWIVKNEGPKPQKGKMVTVHYTGMLTNGNVFDSSVSRKQPF
jgi:FKBP-type peptidyl-prolyl cis-trans isomerase